VQRVCQKIIDVTLLPPAYVDDVLDPERDLGTRREIVTPRIQEAAARAGMSVYCRCKFPEVCFQTGLSRRSVRAVDLALDRFGRGSAGPPAWHCQVPSALRRPVGATEEVLALNIDAVVLIRERVNCNQERVHEVGEVLQSNTDRM
jgi:hypothetical protein